MIAWVIGKEGMLGRIFSEYFNSIDIPVVATSKEEVDITDLKMVREFTESRHFDFWINCAAFTHVDEAEDRKQDAYRVNVQGVENLVTVAKEYQATGQEVKLIHFSTDYVFDGLSHHPYNELDRERPLSVYGQTKLESESLIRSNYDNYLIFRLSWLFAEHGRNFVRTLLTKMRQSEVIYVVDDQFGCPTYARDVARWVWQLRNRIGLYHLCNREETSWHGMAQEISHQAHQLGIELKVQLIEAVSSAKYQAKARRPRYSVFDTSKAIEQGIDFRPWQEALGSCLKRLKESENW